MNQVLLVTGNQHKLEEFKRLAPSIEWTSLGAWELTNRGARGPEIIEDADSFAGNALIKARAGRSRTGLLSIADDSGLCVDALGGAPGIYSARYIEGSDEDRYRKVLEELHDIPAKDRGASFHCALAVCGLTADQRALVNGRLADQPLEARTSVMWEGDDLVVSAQCHGVIGDSPQGAEGFGYDPIFYPSFDQQNGEISMAMMSGSDKDIYSHRGRSLRLLASLLFES